VTELQQNRYDRLLRRVGGLIGAKSMVNDALGELFPMLDVENVPGELLALQPTTLGWCSTILQPSVGDRNHHQLFNPAGSQVLLAVTTVGIDVNSTQFVRFTTFIAALTTLAGNERRRDTRAGTTANIVAQNRTDQSVVNGGLDFRIRAITDTQQIITDENGIAILFPGTGLTISTEATNVQSLVSFMWRERVFEESERVPDG